MQLMIDTRESSYTELLAAIALLQALLPTETAEVLPPLAEGPLHAERVTGMHPDLGAGFTGNDQDAARAAFSPPPAAPASTPAPSIPEAPAPAPVGPAVATPAGELDSANLPWDGRIHSETRAKNKDGTWRFRRNLDATVRDTVLAELRGGPLSDTPAASNTVPQPPVQVPLPPPVQVPLPPATVPVPPPPPVGLPDASDAPVVPAVTSIPTVPMPPSGEAALTFQQLMPRINKALAARTLTMPKVLEVCKAVGLDSITGLATNPGKVPEVATLLGV